MDYDYYVSTYPELAGLDPVEAATHYRDIGWAEGKNPSPAFDTTYYVTENPDVVETNQNPFVHFLIYGRAEGRRPHPNPSAALPTPVDAPAEEQPATPPTSVAPSALTGAIVTKSEYLLDREYYLARYPEVAELIAQGTFRDPVHYYQARGWSEGHDPHPFFSTRYYRQNAPSGDIAGDPFEHYLTSGFLTGLNPSPYVHERWYQAEHGVSATSALEHYEAQGRTPFLNPAGAFFRAQLSSDPSTWFAQNPDLGSKSHYLSELPSEFLDWDLAHDAFGPDGPFLDVTITGLDFSGDRTPTRIDSPVAVYVTEADLERFEPQEIRRSVQLAAAQTSATITLLVPPSCVSDFDELSDERVSVAPLRSGFDLLTNVAMYARSASWDATEALVVRAGLAPSLNAASILVRTLDNTPTAALVGAAILRDDYVVDSSGQWVEGNEVVLGASGLSPTDAAHYLLRTSDSVDSRFFAVRLGPLQDLTHRPNHEPDADMLDHANALRDADFSVWTQGSVFARETVAVPPAATRAVVTNPTKDQPDDETIRDIIVLDVGWLTPDRDAGSVYTFNIIKILLDEGHRVIFGGPALTFDPIYTPLLAGMGVQCLYDTNTLPSADTVLDADIDPDVAYLFRYPIARDFLHEVRVAFPRVRTVFHTLDLHGLRELRQAELDGDLRGINAGNRTLLDELTLMQAADSATVVSHHELEMVRERCHRGDLRILAIPVTPPPVTASSSDDHNICFVGSFVHEPNVDAVEWFLDEVWPIVRDKDPEAHFHIVGQKLPSVVAVDQPGVTYHGFVPDLDALIATMNVSVAPLRFGAGIKGKVISSLAAGLPVVATPLALEGMGMDDNKNALVAKDPGDFADAVLTLLNNKRTWNKISKGGTKLFEASFSMKAVRKQLLECTHAVGVDLERIDR